MNLLCRLWRWFTMQWGRGGSLCGWRPEALSPLSLGASGAGLPRPLLRQAFLAEPRQFAEQHAAEFGEVRWCVLELARPGFDDVLKGPASTVLATANLEFTVPRASGIVHRVEPEQRLATLHLVARREVGGLNGNNPERASLGASVVASAEQLPTSRKAAVGARDFGRRESGTERRHPAGAKRIDDCLGDWLCCSPFSACGMPECRKRVVLGRRSLARPARGRCDGQTQDEEARRGHVRTISRPPSTRLGEPFRSQPRQLSEQHAAKLREVSRWVLKRGEDRRPLGDREREHFRLAAVCGLKAVGEVWVVDEAGELEDGSVYDRNAGGLHSFEPRPTSVRFQLAVGDMAA